MHTDSTLALLSQVTTTLGSTLRTFQEQTCAAFPTQELQREQIARIRRQSVATAESGSSKPKAQKLGNSARQPSVATAESGSSKPKAQKPGNSARQPKQLNLRTYKFHSLGDYPHMIRRFGTIDSYSTQPVSFSCPQAKWDVWYRLSIRANGSTKHQKDGTFGLMGDQYPNNCQRSSNDNVASARFVKTWIPLTVKETQKVSMLILIRVTTWERHKISLYIFRLFYNGMRVTPLSR